MIATAKRIASKIIFLAVVSLLFLPLGPKSQLSGQISSSPDSSSSIIAEWETAKGVFVSWPLVLPDKLLVSFSENVVLHVLVGEDKLQDAKAKMESLKIPSDRVRFLTCSVASGWPRDWGPHQMFGEDGRLAMVDQKFDGYPIYPRKGNKPTFTFRPGKGDDSVNAEIAPNLGCSVVDCAAFVTGGNLLVDGHGTAFCTQSMLTENASEYDEVQLRRLFKTKLGIDRLVVLENTEPLGIQHIDCWLKVVDAETLLVKKTPAGHPEEAPLERNIDVLENLPTAFGRTYRIERIYCPPIKRRTYEPEDKPIAAYTNSLILNKHVYVPLFNVAEDDAALDTWRKVMPGYEVTGFLHSEDSRGWMHFDALHCRSRALFSDTLIRIEHPVLPGSLAECKNGYGISVELRDMSGRGIDEHRTQVHFRLVGQTEWKSVNLAAAHFGNRYVAIINGDELRSGAIVEYYISATSKSGVSVTHPRSAPNHYHRFSIRQ